MTTHTPPSTSITPEMKNISIPCSMSEMSGSMTEEGRSHQMSSATPARVKAARSGRPKRRTKRGNPISTRETPSVNNPACALCIPPKVRSTPRMGRIIPVTRVRHVLSCVGGSGMSLTARTMLSLLTRQEERTTTMKVRTMPRVKAITTLCQLKAKVRSRPLGPWLICEKARRNTNTMVYPMATPSKPPMVAAATIASLLGVAIGYTMVFLLRRAFSQMSQGPNGLDLTFAFSWQSVVIAFTLGIVLTFIVVVLSSWRVSRLNIVRAVRDIPEPPTQERTWRTLVTGIILPILGVLLTFGGIQSAQAGLFTLGVSLVLIGLPLLVRRFGLPERAAFTLAGVALLIWWLLPSSVMEPLISDMEQGIEMFFISGVMLVLGGVWVVIYNSEFLLALIVAIFGRLKGAPPVLKTAVNYPMQSRFRTGMTLAMFSLVVFTLVVMSFIIASMTQVFSNVEAMSGGFEVRASASPLNPVQDIRAEVAAPAGSGSQAGSESGETIDPESFQAVGTISAATVNVRPAASEIPPEQMTVQGADEEYLENVGYGFALRAPGYDSDREVWRALQEEPGTVVVAYSLVPSRNNNSMGEPQPPFQLQGFYAEDEVLPPVQISVSHPETGATEDLTVIGVLEPMAIYAGNIMTSQSSLTRIVGRPVPPQLFWFDLAEEANAGETAKTLERRFLANGMQAADTAQEIRDFSATSTMVTDLLQGFMALGLVVGIAALGVVAARSVVERRQEIGLMRAIGFQKGMVQNSFLVESSFIALLGILIGAGLGFALSPQIIDAMSDQIAGMTYHVPWKPILLIVGVAYGAALLTTIIPARQAARVHPADALRYE